MPGGTVKDCLAAVGAAPAGLRSCSGLKEEWSFIKKAYFKKILTCHPDKGGDAAVFRDVLAAFEVLRELFESSQIKSFASENAQSTADAYKGRKDDFRGMSTPSWEYYAEAAKEGYATYRLELARSARSRCQASGSFIEKGELRIGFMLESGGYGLWVRMGCWRVPSKVWLGLPDPAKTRDLKKFERALMRMNEVSLCGVSELKKTERKKVVRYVMDKKHWTFGGAVEKVRKKPAAGGARAKEADADNADPGGSIVAVAPEREKFVVPIPGRGAPKGSLAGKSFVITGTFPEVGGGAGFKLGKDRVKKMIESFGGKVASSVSGKTDVLVVGKLPGSSKVSKARASRKISLLSIRDLKLGLERGCLEGGKAKPIAIKEFARGFGQRRGGPNGTTARALANKRADRTSRGKKSAAVKAMKGKLTFRPMKRRAIAPTPTPKRRKVSAKT